MIKYTPEQHDILDHMETEDGILLVSAGAGTGKSFMAKQVTHLLQPEKGLYTAFNKAIVEEGISRFRGTNMECKTLHALAYKYVNPKSEIQDMSYSCITEDISYSDKYEILTAINMFFVSASTDMYEFMEEYFEGSDTPEHHANLACKYIELMLAGDINPTFNFLLKYFHLLLVEGSVVCSYDLVILDEINDTTAVALEIFKLIQSPKKLGLGETNQAIYDFLNLVDGFELLSDVPQLSLTHSWRCSEEIAENIQTFMQRDVSKKFTFIGTDEPVENGKELYCTLTNAKIIDAISYRLESRKGFHLLRKLSEIFSYPLAIVAASSGKQVYQKKYKHLETEYRNWNKNRRRGYSYYQHLLEHLSDQETRAAINLLLSLNRRDINIFDLYKKAQKAEVDTDYVIATVYTSKGLEFETVELADDLNNAINRIRENGGIQTHEDLVLYRCYYVAASRAGKNLINAIALKC